MNQTSLSTLVHKLGHQLEEIRVRALRTIVSKLDYGLITEAELIDRDNLFENLVKWFEFETVCLKDDVLKLILRLIKASNEASTLLLQADPTLARLREVTDCDVLVQDIVNLTSKQVNSARYAISVSSDNTKVTRKTIRVNKSSNSPRTYSRATKSSSTRNLNTARSLSTNSKKTSNHDFLTPGRGPDPVFYQYKEPSTAKTNETVPTLQLENKENLNPSRYIEEEDMYNQIIWSLPRYFLVASDQQVLTTLENSFTNTKAVAQSCHFFTSVLIRDFPAEVFIQSPGIIREMTKLMKSSSINQPVVESLSLYTKTLHDRLLFCSQLEFTSLKSEGRVNAKEGTISETQQTPRDVAQQYQLEGSLSSGSDQQNADKVPEHLTIPQYCLETLTAAVQWMGQVQDVSTLVMRVLQLVKAVIPDVRCIWENKARHRIAVLYNLSSTLLERLVIYIKKSVKHNTIVEVHAIAISLQIVESLVPRDLAPLVLPTELQEIICLSLIDCILVVNYPKLHDLCLSYASVLKRKGMLLYQDVSIVLEAMEASVKFSQEAASVPTHQALDLFRSALPALPFHQQLHMVKEFTQYLMERHDLSDSELEQAAALTRSLLAHSDKSIAEETYRVFWDTVTSTLGPKQALSDTDPCPRLRFFIHTSVLVEIVCFGATSADNQIREYAEDIVLHLLKCQMLVSDTSWCQVMEQFAPVLPLLQCLASKSSPLGRTVLDMLDPDTTHLSSLQVLSGNCRLLFHKDPLCREEAATRLLWLTKPSQPHKRLADICLLDVAVTGHTPVTGMYEEGSVVRVLEVLSGPCVEARVKQSALTQLSVMTEDSRLHQVFVDQCGVEVFTDMFYKFVEEINEEASSFIVPIVSTLKHLARYNATVRQNLSHNEKFLLCVLKSMFELTEWRLQRDAAQLLALLLYADFVLSSAASVSLPQLVTERLSLPFRSQPHWTVSPNTTTSLRGVVMGCRGSERVLALKWTILQQGLDYVLRLNDVPSPNTPLSPSLRAIRIVQHSHAVHNCRLLLHDFQNATTHQSAIEALSTLTLYLELYWFVDSEPFSTLGWKNTFNRFLLTPPSCQDDFILLLMVLKFLLSLLIACPSQSVWVTQALQTSPHTILNLIIAANSAHVRDNDEKEMWKKICQSTLNLCKLCVKQRSTQGWQVLVHIIMQCLDFSNTLPFYSLGLLDSKLECLLAALHKQTVSSVLWQLLTAFHCESTQSCMGISITKHTLLGLNKLLHLTQDWERSWLCEANISWLPGMCMSRHVLVRTCSFQLMSGLARSVRGVATLIQHAQGLIDLAFRCVVDHSEASAVREQAATLLANIVKNSSSKEFAALAQKFNLYHEFRDSVGLVALSPISRHVDPSSQMLHTHPRFIKAGSWLVNNILASTDDETTHQLIFSSSLSITLWRTIIEVEKLENCDVVSMFGAICKLLTHCKTCFEAISLQDSLSALMHLLDPANFVEDSADMMTEVKTLWQEVLRLLTAVLSHSKVEFILSDTAVNTLCQCVAEAGQTSLKMSALHAIPTIANHLTAGDEVAVCEALLFQLPSASGKVGAALLAALSALLALSSPATQTTLDAGVLSSLVSNLQQIHLTLTVQTSSTDKLRKNNPTLTQLAQYFTLLTNLLYDSECAKSLAAQMGLADNIHKLWVWCTADTKYLLQALDLLITFTADCVSAAATLVLTSTVPGVGQRKSPTSHSLVHTLVTLLTGEQHPLTVKSKSLLLLQHCCQAQECRTVLVKSCLLSKWSDQWLLKKQPAEELEVAWLNFIKVLTFFQEGQITVPKIGDIFHQLIQCAESGRPSCRGLALAILRNLAANNTNRPRFLSTRSSLVLLGEKLLSDVTEEKRDAALIVWALAANHQKAKVTLRGLGLVNRLQLAAATSGDDIFSFVADLLKPS